MTWPWRFLASRSSCNCAHTGKEHRQRPASPYLLRAAISRHLLRAALHRARSPPNGPSSCMPLRPHVRPMLRRLLGRFARGPGIQPILR